MDKMTYVSHVWQAPPGTVIRVTTRALRYTNPGCMEDADYHRNFNSPACADAWADAYPDKLDEVYKVKFVHPRKVPRGERKCWHCSLEVCNDVERSVALALGYGPA